MGGRAIVGPCAEELKSFGDERLVVLRIDDGLLKDLSIAGGSDVNLARAVLMSRQAILAAFKSVGDCDFIYRKGSIRSGIR